MANPGNLHQIDQTKPTPLISLSDPSSYSNTSPLSTLDPRDQPPILTYENPSPTVTSPSREGGGGGGGSSEFATVTSPSSGSSSGWASSRVPKLILEEPSSNLAITHDVPSPRHRRSPRATVTSPKGGGWSGRHPTYRGIRCRNGKWVTEMREPRKSNRIWLGTHPTPEMAAAAYDVAALALKGPKAVLNFPESIPSYPVPASPSQSDVQAAAAAAAAARLPRAETGEGLEQSEVKNEGTSSGQEFMDEDAIFGMPNLLVDMAEGMLLTPPRIKVTPSDDSVENSDAESDLWS
ncbi:hypothetical protein Vadar_026681 [Vaccinium darrowii]|uniref:Uncharacterized protein n=1 Tax=Vaccinium darrowii TaxID=229202 RepID=A0ACB7XKG9_9ERIC|nr:hypothetical protein Vadar_026681 [Vaccinium darrowii]